MISRASPSLAAGLALLLVAGCGLTPSPSAQGPPAVERFTTADVEEAVEDLAQLGIETRVAPSDASPIAPAQGGTSSVRLLRHQVRNLALELTAGGGTRGADLDALSAAGGGFAVSPLIAGWADSAATDASRWAASLLREGRPADSSATVFPTLVLVAFVADASRGGGETSDSPGAVLAISQSRSRGSADAVSGVLTADNSTDFCAEVSAYLSAALDDVVNTEADPPPWLSQLIDLYAPQYASDPEALRRTIGAVALLSYATSLARSWTVNLVPDPLAVAYGIEGQEPVQGDVVLTVASGQDVFTEDVADCASLADAQLASIPIEGSAVIWDSTGLGGHANEISSFTTLDDVDSAGLTYETTTESQEDAENGDPVTAQMWVNAWVDRAEMASLAAVVKSILLGEAGGTPAGSTAKALYQAMEPTLNTVMRPSGFAFVDVTYHTTADLSGTWEGTWQNDIEWRGIRATGGVALELEQVGAQVTGTARFSGMTCVGEVPVEGTAQGSAVNLSMPSEWDIRFVGTVEGDSMSGTYSAIVCETTAIVTGIASVTGTWQATRE